MKFIHKTTLPFVLLLSYGIISLPANANDSLAVLAAGGLQLETSADIVMEEEELFLSTKDIRVRYTFRNESDNDITARVAFPLPDLTFGPIDNYMLPNEHDPNFVDFSVTVDGKQITPLLEERAFSVEPMELSGVATPQGLRPGTDVTAKLKAADLPLNARLTSWAEKLRSIPAQTRETLIKENILQELGTDDLAPLWSLRATYHWEQAFPVGKRIVVEHRYKPVVGSRYFSGQDWSHGLGWGAAEMKDYEQQFCLDRAGKAGVEHLLDQAAAQSTSNNDTFVLADEVQYILTTGANWKGPIKRFKLTIDKGLPHGVLSLCMDGIRKTGQTTFEINRTDFTPVKDVRFVVFYRN